eukprot:TRINITY_DN3454_c0_g1_i1.p1 TRINITY_DN3454_c0_g1~~TRINITY_DN3454_c0_g1_i1.p1  ORF type:complete len:278 (+),score=64.90 TRINITY_DN3454_c0_g1_i1:32-835(+)
MDKQLSGKIALVTGATRGIGKGIAIELAKAGALVYFTGRTVKEGEGEDGLPGSLETTLKEIEKVGGKGVPFACDHTNDEKVKQLFEKITAEDRLDILVNNVFKHNRKFFSKKPFWEKPLDVWTDANLVGLRSHYICSCFAAPLMTSMGRGLIVTLSSVAGQRSDIITDVAYCVGKSGDERLAQMMALELKDHNVCSIALVPSLVKTELVTKIVKEEKLGINLDNVNVQTPSLIGRVVVKLASQSNIMSKTGSTLLVADLAKEYDLKD